MFRVLFVALCIPGLIFVRVQVNASPVVQLGKTAVVGQDIEPLKQEFFGGIPYAEPPLGNLRLRPPVLKTSLKDDTFNATEFGPACLQPADPSTINMSEDCLTINVLRPAGLSTNAGLPVMVWVYGGSFLVGTGADPSFNASMLIARSVARGTPTIYVNLNYRLGPLGFPQGDEAARRGALNLGLKDQLAALEWVQANIGAFGGDNSKVTVFGQSAGAISLAILLLSPSFEQLARAAIFESGSAASSPTFLPAHRQLNWQVFVGAVPECASLAQSANTFSCLEASSSSSLLQAISTATTTLTEDEVPFPPNIDGPGGVLPDLPSKLLFTVRFAHLPFISGTNLDEGSLFTPTTINSTQGVLGLTDFEFTQPPLTPDVTQAVNKLLELYPDIPALGSPFNTGNETFGLNSQYKRASALVTDLSFASQRRLLSQTAANVGIRSYAYLFTQPQSASLPRLGVYHSSEVQYVYGLVLQPAGSDLALSGIMMEYWLSFAACLDPNDGRGTQRPNWSEYTREGQVLLQLNGDNTTVIADDFRKSQIQFISDHAVEFNN